MSAARLRLAVVGATGPGRSHAAAAAASGAFDVVGACDLDAGVAAELAAAHPGCVASVDFAKLLAELRPDAVAIATNEGPRARLTLQAVEAGVRGVYAEKPMAVHPADARRMVAACREKGVVLLVNHQRRTRPEFRTLRKVIADGMIGKPEHILASSAGDILSDGTHTMDTVRYLAGDAPVKWLLGQVYRDRPDPAAARGMSHEASGGYRFGHAVETGAFAEWEHEGGLRVTFLSGALHLKGRWYQDYEVFGTEGRVRRPAESQGVGGVKVQRHDRAGWEEVPFLPDDPVNERHRGLGVPSNYAAFARSILTGEPHPLDGEHGLAAMELVTAVYESARLNARVAVPVAQDRFPLDLMIEAGRL